VIRGADLLAFVVSHRREPDTARSDALLLAHQSASVDHGNTAEPNELFNAPPIRYQLLQPGIIGGAQSRRDVDDLIFVAQVERIAPGKGQEGFAAAT
jgi:hypothetical protein